MKTRELIHYKERARVPAILVDRRERVLMSPKEHTLRKRLIQNDNAAKISRVAGTEDYGIKSMSTSLLSPVRIGSRSRVSENERNAAQVVYEVSEPDKPQGRTGSGRVCSGRCFDCFRRRSQHEDSGHWHHCRVHQHLHQAQQQHRLVPPKRRQNSATQH